MTADNLNPRLARWVARLKLYDFEILYRPGPENGNADALSRLALDKPTEDNDDETTPVSINNIQIRVINIDASNAKVSQLLDENIRWIYELKLRASQQNIHTIIEATPTNSEQRSYYQQWNRLRIVGKNVFREIIDQANNVKYQYIVPQNQRDQAIKRAHENGHFGVDKTMERIREKSYRPKYYQDTNAFVKCCEICQLTKPPVAYNNAALIPIASNKPFELVCSDMMVRLPETKNGYVNLLLIVDHFSKWIELYPNENNPRLPSDFLVENPQINHEFEPCEYAENLKWILWQSYEIVRKNIDYEVQAQKFYHDRILRPAEYNIGDQVKFLDKAAKINDAKKFKRKWKGPCTVLDRTSLVNYKIKPPSGKSRLEHVNRLQKFNVYCKPEHKVEIITLEGGTQQIDTKKHRQHTVEDQQVSDEASNRDNQQTDVNLKKRRGRKADKTIPQDIIAMHNELDKEPIAKKSCRNLRKSSKIVAVEKTEETDNQIQSIHHYNLRKRRKT